MKRLAIWLPCIISEEQTGFVPSRSMHDCTALAHDLAYVLTQKTTGGNVILNLNRLKLTTDQFLGHS